MKSIPFKLSLFAALHITGSAIADDIQKLDGVVVTAKSNSSIKEVAASAHVISAESIARSGATT